MTGKICFTVEKGKNTFFNNLRYSSVGPLVMVSMQLEMHNFSADIQDKQQNFVKISNINEHTRFYI